MWGNLLGTGGLKIVPGEALQGTISEESSLRLESALRRVVEERESEGKGNCILFDDLEDVWIPLPPPKLLPICKHHMCYAQHVCITVFASCLASNAHQRQVSVPSALHASPLHSLTFCIFMHHVTFMKIKQSSRMCIIRFLFSHQTYTVVSQVPIHLLGKQGNSFHIWLCSHWCTLVKIAIHMYCACLFCILDVAHLPSLQSSIPFLSSSYPLSSPSPLPLLFLFLSSPSPLGLLSSPSFFVFPSFPPFLLSPPLSYLLSCH